MTMLLNHSLILDELENGHASPTKGKILSKVNSLDKTKAMRDIRNAVALFNERERRRYITEPKRRKALRDLHTQYEKLHKTLLSARDSLKDILETTGKADPLFLDRWEANGYGWDDWKENWNDECSEDSIADHIQIDVEADLKKAHGNIVAIDRWITRGAAQAKKARPPANHPIGSPLQRLIRVLGAPYYQHTGSMPSYSRSNDGWGQAQGAFLYFVDAIAANAITVNSMGEEVHLICTLEGVAGALDTVVKAPDWWQGLHEPVPSECPDLRAFDEYIGSN